MKVGLIVEGHGEVFAAHPPAEHHPMDFTPPAHPETFDKLFREVGRLFGLTVPPR